MFSLSYCKPLYCPSDFATITHFVYTTPSTTMQYKMPTLVILEDTGNLY